MLLSRAPQSVIFQRVRHGFTLVEVLLVTSIISLLIAMLLPSLASSRQMALRSVDISNLREFTISCTAYAGDYREHLPYAWRWNHNQDHYRWFRMQTYQALVKYGVTLETSTCNSLNYKNSGKPTGDPNVTNPANRLNDTHIGWLYWGNRQDILPYAGSQGHKSYQRLSGKYSPSSQTLVTCVAEDTKEVFWNAIAPHVAGSDLAQLYPGFNLYSPKPEGLHVGYVDSSASWVPFVKLTAIREAHTYSPYGTVFFHNR